MTKSKKGGGMKETFTGIIDTMERFVNDKVLNKNNNHKNHNNHNNTIFKKYCILITYE